MAFQAIPGVPEGFQGKIATRTFDPLLLPRWYSALSVGAGQVGYLSPEAYLAANPRADASDTLTITGTPGAGDIVAVTLTNPILPNGALTLTYTVSGSPTVTQVAAGIVALINASQTCRAFGIVAENAAGVITVYHNGPMGNFTVGTVAVTQVGGTTAAAWAASGVFTGGSGPVVPVATFNIFYGTNLFQFYYGRPVSIGSGALAAFNAAGCPLA